MIFNEQIAKELGIHEAVVYGYIDGWIATNRKKKNHKKHEGKYWMFQSVADMATEMPYLSERTIRRCIDKLFQAGYIAKGYYNRKGYDRTTWYTTANQGRDEMTKFPSQLAYNTKPMRKQGTDEQEDKSNTLCQDGQMDSVIEDTSIASQWPNQYHHDINPTIHHDTNQVNNHAINHGRRYPQWSSKFIMCSSLHKYLDNGEWFWMLTKKENEIFLWDYYNLPPTDSDHELYQLPEKSVC